MVIGLSIRVNLAYYPSCIDIQIFSFPDYFYKELGKSFVNVIGILESLDLVCCYGSYGLADAVTVFMCYILCTKLEGSVIFAEAINGMASAFAYCNSL